MELIKMEWKRIIFNNSLWIFFALHIIILILVCNPYRLCRNTAPMDFKHRALRLLVEDCDKKVLVNDMLQEDMTSMKDTLEQYKSVYKDENAVADVDADIQELEDKLSKLNGKEKISLSDYERKVYKDNVKNILNLCGLSGYKIHDLENMDTHKFQKLSIRISKKELTKNMDKLNDYFGGCTYYGKCKITGRDYLKQKLEIRYYAADFEVQYKNNNQYSVLGINDSVDFYDKEIASNGYNGMYSAYILDKMQIILCLLLPVVFMPFAYLKKKQDYFVATINSFSFLCKKYIAYCSVIVGIEAVIFGAYQFFLIGYAKYLGCQIVFLKPLLLFIEIILPEVLFLGAVCVLAAMLSNTVMMFFVCGAFFVSAMQIKDVMFSKHIIVRFNHIAQTMFLNDYLNKIKMNRLIYICVALCIFGLAVILYSFIRNGKLESYFNQIKIIQIKIRGLSKILFKSDDAEISPKTNWLILIVKHHVINYYMVPMLLFSVYFVFVILLFNRDMPATELCSRFLPMLGIAIAGAAALYSQEFRFEDILVSKGLKQDIFIKNLLGIILSFSLSVVFAYIVLSEISLVLFMTIAATVILNIICLIISNSKTGAVGGIAVSVGCYIMYNMFL